MAAAVGGFYLGDSFLTLPLITGVIFNNSPFHTSCSKILGNHSSGIKLNPTEKEAVQWGAEMGMAVCNQSVG